MGLSWGSQSRLSGQNHSLVLFCDSLDGSGGDEILLKELVGALHHALELMPKLTVFLPTSLINIVSIVVVVISNYTYFHDLYDALGSASWFVRSLTSCEISISS